MDEQEASRPPRKSSSSILPALVPSASLLLYKTQTTLGLLREVVQESSAVYWYERGKTAYSSNDFVMAEFCFHSCLEHDNDYWQAKLQLAILWAKSQNISRTADALQKAYEGKYPDSCSFRNELSTSEWQALRIAFQNRRADDSENFKTQLALLIIDTLSNKRSLQCKFMTELGVKHPNESWNSSSYQRIYGWSIMYYSEEEFELVSHHYEQYFSRATECNPLNSHAYIDWALFERRRGNSRKFINYINHAIELNPGCTTALIQRGIFFCKAAAAGGDSFFDKALLDFNRVIELSPRNGLAYLYRILIKKDIGDNLGAAEDQETHDSLFL